MTRSREQIKSDVVAMMHEMLESTRATAGPVVADGALFLHHIEALMHCAAEIVHVRVAEARGQASSDDVERFQEQCERGIAMAAAALSESYFKALGATSEQTRAATTMARAIGKKIDQANEEYAHAQA